MPSSLRNPYQTQTGNAWVRPSWVVFLDILGFVESIRKAEENGEQVNHLKQLRSALAAAKEELTEGIEDDDWIRDKDLPAPYVVKVFTDNIVLGFPIHDDGEIEFGGMLARVGWYQYTLLKHGFFVRGGIAFGDLYMDDDVVYGKGLLDANDAEKTLARDPRIVLGPTAMEQVHTHLAWYAKVAFSPHNEQLLVDSDSQMFVNYLAIPIDGLDKNALPAEYHNDLSKHRDLIITKLQEFSEVPTLWSKYAWVGTYHNLFCTEFIPGEQHLISPEKLSQPARRLADVYTRQGPRILKGGKVVGKFKHLAEFKVQKEPR